MTEFHSNSYAPAYIAHQRGRRGVKIHWRVFFIVNCCLFALNIIVGNWYPWFLWPLMSWGIGIAIHASVITILYRRENNSQRGMLIHFACFLIVSIYLLFVNVITGTWYFYPWFLWPVAGWAIGIGEHFVAYKYIQGRDTRRPTSRFHTLWYPGVVCLFLAFVDIFSDGWFDWFWWPTIPIMVTTFLIVGTITQSRMRIDESEPHVHPRSTIDEFSTATDTRPSERSPDRRFCPKCGETVQSGHPYCEYCGMKLQ